MSLFCLQKWLDLKLKKHFKYDSKMKRIMTGGKFPLFSNGDLEYTTEMAIDEPKFLGHNFEAPTVAMKKEFIHEYGADNQVQSIKKQI